VAADLEGLKDDNVKLSKLIKENAKQMGVVRELKAANEQLRANERRLRDEIVSLNDRVRGVKSEA
jgi:cell division protein FtsB